MPQPRIRINSSGTYIPKSAPKAELFVPAPPLLLALKEEALLSLLISVEVPGVRSARLLPALLGVPTPLLLAPESQKSAYKYMENGVIKASSGRELVHRVS